MLWTFRVMQKSVQSPMKFTSEMDIASEKHSIESTTTDHVITDLMILVTFCWEKNSGYAFQCKSRLFIFPLEPNNEIMRYVNMLRSFWDRSGKFWNWHMPQYYSHSITTPWSRSNEAVFIIFPEVRNTFQYPLMQTRVKTPRKAPPVFYDNPLIKCMLLRSIIWAKITLNRKFGNLNSTPEVWKIVYCEHNANVISSCSNCLCSDICSSFRVCSVA